MTVNRRSPDVMWMERGGESAVFRPVTFGCLAPDLQVYFSP
mgnify:FL=1